jgi:hypothetical protein
MQWSDENNFDWRAGLQNLEAEPSDADNLWLKIESRLDASQTRRGGLIILRRYASIAAASAILMLATTWLWLSDTPTENQPMASGIAPQPTISKHEIVSPESNNVDVLPKPAPAEKIEKKSAVIPTLPPSETSTLPNAPTITDYTVSKVDSLPEIHPSKLYQAGLVALGKGQYCTSHYNMTLAKMSLCQKDHLNHEVDQMIRFVEDKIATNCFCMADPNETGNCQ